MYKYVVVQVLTCRWVTNVVAYSLSRKIHHHYCLLFVCIVMYRYVQYDGRYGTCWYQILPYTLTYYSIVVPCKFSPTTCFDTTFIFHPPGIHSGRFIERKRCQQEGLQGFMNGELTTDHRPPND